MILRVIHCLFCIFYIFPARFEVLTHAKKFSSANIADGAVKSVLSYGLLVHLISLLVFPHPRAGISPVRIDPPIVLIQIKSLFI